MTNNNTFWGFVERHPFIAFAALSTVCGTVKEILTAKHTTVTKQIVKQEANEEPEPEVESEDVESEEETVIE